MAQAVVDKEKAMLAERKRLLEQKEAELAEAEGDDADDAAKIARLQSQVYLHAVPCRWYHVMPWCCAVRCCVAPCALHGTA